MTDQPLPPPPPPAAPPPRTLRRSATDRVAAGVCGGLGEYFAVDPVLFRVLFAVTGFFGIGILVYIAAWVAIPEQGAVDAPIDRITTELRRRKVPFWAVVTVAALVAWAIVFSWWSPWPFFPIVVAAVVVGVALQRRPAAQPVAPPTGGQSGGPVPPPSPGQGGDAFAGQTEHQPAYRRSELSAWAAESRAASRERRSRSAPVRWATLSALVLTLGILAICDVVGGIVIPAYFWAVIAVVVVGLGVGLALHRTPWTLAVLLLPAIFGAFVFNGTQVSFTDGSGDRAYTPHTVSALDGEYRQAFGRTTLDLTELAAPSSPHTVLIRQAAGEVRVVVPRDLPVVVHGDIHLGAIEVDGRELHDGYNFDRDVTTGPRDADSTLTVDVDINAGQLTVDRVG